MASTIETNLSNLCHSLMYNNYTLIIIVVVCVCVSWGSQNATSKLVLNLTT